MMKNPLLNPELRQFQAIKAELYPVRPIFYKPTRSDDAKAFSELLKKMPGLFVQDSLHDQLRELMKLRHPSVRLTESSLTEAIKYHLDGCPEWAFGEWVYYPWNDRLVHLLGKEEFVEVRTNRNLYKITPKEKDILATQKIGVIGLSVGQSVAMTLAMERTFGELRIADFDTLELSNINRIRTGVYNLGLPKTVIVSREIAEIDPFLTVTCFHEGISAVNMDDFIGVGDEQLDLLIDECDSLDIKVLCRQKARASRIPVLMDTSDRGMIDIERFDLEPGRPLFHGLVTEEELSKGDMQDPGLRIQLSMKIAGADNLSQRMKDSIGEIGKTISTWPQLASAVTLGGAAVGEISRKIALNESIPSGRFYVDISEIIKTG